MPGFQQMSDALTEMVKVIMEDYRGFQDRGTRNQIKDEISNKMYKEFCDGLHLVEGSKYIKITTKQGSQTSVHSFVCKKDNPKKGLKEGDILKAASWNAPALNFIRGNVSDRTFDRVRWTGVQ